VEALKALLLEGPMAEATAALASEAAPYLVHQVWKLPRKRNRKWRRSRFLNRRFSRSRHSMQDNAEPAYAGEQSSDPFQRKD